MRLCFLAAFLVAFAFAERPKLKDQISRPLVRITDIGEGCDSSTQHGFGMVDGMLEKCDLYTAVKAGTGNASAYEDFKCKHLRLRAQVKEGKCVCQSRWEGPICHNYKGCKNKETWFNGKCIQDGCWHEGTMAVGTKQVECTCPVPWDGRHCERLACWRKTPHGFERRFRNANDHCECGEHYEGANCDVPKSCMNNGTVSSGVCTCPLGWGGEICDKKLKCTKQEDGTLVCAASSIYMSLAFILLAVYHQLF